MSNADVRFGEQAFRRYEPYLVALIAQWPTPLEVNPAPYSVETFAARIRDAARGFVSNGWYSEYVKLEDFKDKWSLTEVKISKAGTVILFPRIVQTGGILAKDPLTSQGQLGSVTTAKGLVVSNPDLNIIRALLLLHEKAVLTTPTKVENLTPELVIYLTTQEEFLQVGISITSATTCNLL